jgi:DNA repair protein SbcD/Mre11
VALKLLAVGDMHLGRRPSRLPGALVGQADELGPAGAWRRVVEAALAEGVDAVALAGDVVERENDFYEAYRSLHAGVTELAQAGIRVLGVAGNHDVQVLPRLADQIPEFHLVGRDGEWEAVPIEAGGERLTLWGWSFPRQQVGHSPLEGQRFERQGGSNLGLLHCDRDQRGSPYAPVMSRELEAAGLDGWLLGHIHAPDALAGPSPSGYLGSVTGMDPGEPGARGPWLVTVERGQVRQVSQWVLAPLRWQPIELDLNDLERPELAHDRLLERLKDIDGGFGELTLPPEAVGLRVNLVGRTRFGEEIIRQFSEDIREQVFIGAHGTHYFIEKLISVTRPEIPLEELAGRDDPLGLLARRLRLLDGPADDETRRTLIAKGRRRLELQGRDARWQALEAAALDDEVVAEWLRQAGTRLLERMLAQRETAA